MSRFQEDEKPACSPYLCPTTLSSSLVSFSSKICIHWQVFNVRGPYSQILCLLMQETQVQSLGQVDPLEEEMATHSRILAEEPGGLQSRGWQRVAHNVVPKQQQRLDTEHKQAS